MPPPPPESSGRPDPAPDAVVSEENDTRLRWYQGVPRYAWTVLIIAALGWLFDTMDQNIFNLVRQPSLQDILKDTVPPEQLKAATSKLSGDITALFLIGWAIGGFLFGMIGDRFGRARTMALTILIYATFTGLTGLTNDPFWYGFCRFMTALGVGGEFAAGAALVAEVFPQRSRAMALGTLQSLSAVGNMMAAVVTFSLSEVNNAWRWAYAVGALPALLIFFIRRVVKEPEKWVEAQAAAQAENKALGSIPGLFADRQLARNTIAGTLMALAGVGGLWGVGFWLPELTTLALGSAGLSDSEMTRTRSLVFLVQQVGAFFGMFAYAVLSERTGRRPALLLFFVLAFLAVQGTFRFLHDLPSAFLWAPILGFCALAPFSAYAVYFPELFPTRLRATGVGFCYNCARLLAALAPYALGTLARNFHQPGDPAAGLRTAASIVACIYVVGLLGVYLAPETKGKPLPE
ncbi:MAG TPA: MFS transporter [Armatimonadaceae bacterium]|nr:MFS transporter [Armatimonadaceae bacterium]